MTYTAADSTGKIIGGGIGPGVAVKLFALTDKIDALPEVNSKIIFSKVEELVESRGKINVFANSTINCIVFDLIQELKNKLQSIIAEWLSIVGPPCTIRNRPRPQSSILKENLERHVYITGGDGKLFELLLKPQIVQGFVFSEDASRNHNSSSVKYNPQIIHYGMCDALNGALAKEKDQSNEEIESNVILKGHAESQKNASVDTVSKKQSAVEKIKKEAIDMLSKKQIPIEKITNKAAKTSSGKSKQKAKSCSPKREKNQRQDSSSRRRKCKSPDPFPRRRNSQSLDPSPRKRKIRTPELFTFEVPSSQSRKTNELEKVHVGTRVAKYFDGGLFFGKVKTPLTQRGFWKIVYDDGDEEDYDHEDMQGGLSLYRKAKDKNPGEGRS
mmetsp:Transcript_36113/g.84364  ORF Transcript_36113/g.84364 Transcript_36113/m.84364 type:complete len:385 (-) Transcript_36113:303-1457(-)